MVVSVVRYVIIDPQCPSIWVTFNSEHSIKIKALYKDGWTQPEHEGLVCVNGGSLSRLPRPLPEVTKGSPSLDHVKLQVYQDVE